MDMLAYIDEIKLKLTGGVLELEIDDITLLRLVNSCLRELQRYIHSSRLVTLDFSSCIDVKEYKISAVHNIYVADSTYGGAAGTGGTVMNYADPLYVQAFSFSNGNISLLTNYVNNYTNYIYASQTLNSLGMKDLEYRFVKQEEKLYINANVPCRRITIEYVPRFDNVEELTDDYWIDALMKMCVAMAKLTVGRIRTRYTQNSSLWQLDGSTILQEGITEMKELTDYLKRSAGDLRPSI